jgi:radical SAM protein with 4Fe4S-binding SPASM domain
MPRLAALKERGFTDGLLIQPGNNLGFFGPEEAVLRSPKAGMSDHFQTCQAGRQLLGIESNGAVKGCPSLQTSHYVGGNLRERPLAALWSDPSSLAFTRTRTVDDLWGFCRTCPFAAQCLGGCSFTAHALMGRPGNNPLCHYRARALASRGLQERLVPRRPAPQEPFDCAVYEVIEEPFGLPEAPRPGPVGLLARWTG